MADEAEAIAPWQAPRTGAAKPRKVRNTSELVHLFETAERVFLPGSAGEVTSLVDALCEDKAPALKLTASFVPGINPLPLDRLPEETTVTSVFVQAGSSKTQASRRMRHLPLSYGAFVQHLKGMSFDTCVVQVAPPDQDGRCSLGPAVEFTPIAASRSRRIVAVVNSSMPRIPHAESLLYSEFDVVLELDAPLRQYDVGAPSEQATIIARHIANFIEDGSALQIGLGKVPDALLRILKDRRNLRLHSGMLSDGTRTLMESGSLDSGFLHTSCVHVGTSSYYAWLAERPDFAVRGCDYTHAPGVLEGLSRLVAVNSALTVDLFGQANLEMIEGRMVSGVGGAADFARGAGLSPDGISIIALPATSGRNDVSRIVTNLQGVCSIPRNDIDVVVTEHGAADLRNSSVVERAERLIAIAGPQHRDHLETQFRAIAERL
jgi:acyl-CoA hydrolase